MSDIGTTSWFLLPISQAVRTLNSSPDKYLRSVASSWRGQCNGTFSLETAACCSKACSHLHDEISQLSAVEVLPGCPIVQSSEQWRPKADFFLCCTFSIAFREDWHPVCDKKCCYRIFCAFLLCNLIYALPNTITFIHTSQLAANLANGRQRSSRHCAKHGPHRIA